MTPRPEIRSRLFLLSAFAITFTAVSGILGAATLDGRVTDPQSQPIPGVVVELRGPQTAARRAVTDADGTYSFAGLADGAYVLRLAAEGFKPASREAQLDGADASVSLDVELERLALAAEITVTSSLPDFVSGLDLDREVVEARGQADLVQALRYESGLSAIRRGPINLEPSVRGLQENEVGMFVDGTRTFAAGPARMDSDLSHVSQHAIENVQVVKGPYALTWGSGTMSAIELRTFRPPFTSGGSDWGGRLFGAYSDNSEATDGYLNLWHSSERSRFTLSHNDRSGGDYEAGDGSTVPGDFDSAETRWRAEVKLSDRAALAYSGGYQGQDDLDYPGRLLDATYFKTRSHNLDYRWTGGGGALASLHLQAFVNRKDHLMNNEEKPTARDMPGRVPPFGLRIELPTESNTAGGRAGADLEHTDRLSSRVGTDFYRSEQTAARRISRRADGRLLFEDIVWPDARIDDLGLYWQTIKRGDGIELGGTLRIDRVRASAGEVSSFLRTNVDGDLDQDETNVSAALSVAARAGNGWLVSAGLGRAVRTASTLERYSDRFPATKFQLPAEFMGDPELDPEQSLELNFGTRYGSGRLSFVVDLFYRQIDDYITIVPDPTLPKRLPLSPPVVFRYINGREAEFWGGELRLEQAISDRFSWRGRLDYVRADDELLDEPVLGIQPLQAELALRVQSRTGRYWIDLETLLSDRQDRVASRRFERPTPGYTLFGVRGGVRLERGLELFAGVENLTDKAYSHHLNSPNPFLRQRIPEIGRNAQLGLSFSW